MATKFYKYKERTFKQSKADSLVLSDSLGRNIRYIYKTDTFFYPGCRIGTIEAKIASGEIQIRKYSYITLLVGTNDLSPASIWKFYKREKNAGRSGHNLPFHINNPPPAIVCAYRKLLETIKFFNPNCKIIVCGLLPRPYDNHRNKGHHTEVNKEIAKLCNDCNSIFVRTNTSFLKFGSPCEDLFSDGLHLSTKGNRLLNKIISNNINLLRLQKKLN